MTPHKEWERFRDLVVGPGETVLLKAAFMAGCCVGSRRKPDKERQEFREQALMEMRGLSEHTGEVEI